MQPNNRTSQNRGTERIALEATLELFYKKMNTIAQYEGPYAGSFCIGSMISAVTGLKLLLDRNRIIERVVLDNNGDVVSNKAEYLEWIKKVEANNEEITNILVGAGFTKAKFISNTGESFTYAMETKIEPFSSSLEYKIMLGAFGVAGLIALYSAYKIFNTPEKTPEATPDN